MSTKVKVTALIGLLLLYLFCAYQFFQLQKTEGGIDFVEPMLQKWVLHKHKWGIASDDQHSDDPDTGTAPFFSGFFAQHHMGSDSEAGQEEAAAAAVVAVNNDERPGADHSEPQDSPDQQLGKGVAVSFTPVSCEDPQSALERNAREALADSITRDIESFRNGNFGMKLYGKGDWVSDEIRGSGRWEPRPSYRIMQLLGWHAANRRYLNRVKAKQEGRQWDPEDDVVDREVELEGIFYEDRYLRLSQTLHDPPQMSPDDFIESLEDERIYSGGEAQKKLINGYLEVMKERREARFGKPNPLKPISPFSSAESDMLAPTKNNRSLLLDIGANIGWMSLFAAANGHEAIAFEPFVRNVQLIKESMCAKGNKPFKLLERIKLYMMGLDTEERACEVWQVPDTNFGDTHTVCDVQTRASYKAQGLRKMADAKFGTLDAAYERGVFYKKVDVLKLDVEGYEPVVLRGGKKFLASPLAPDHLMIEVSPKNLHDATGRDGKKEAEQMFKFLLGLGYVVSEAGSVDMSTEAKIEKFFKDHEGVEIPIVAALEFAKRKIV